MRAVFEILNSVFSFCNTKDYYYWKQNFCRFCVRNPASELLHIDQKSKKWQRRHNFLTWRQRHIFWRCFISLVKFSYWSKFHVNIITGSGIMTIFFYKGLTRNPEIGNNPVWILPNIWRLGQVMDTKFGANVSDRMLPNAASSVTAFTFFELLKENHLGGGGLTPLSPTQIRVNSFTEFWHALNVINYVSWRDTFVRPKVRKYIKFGLEKLSWILAHPSLGLD